MNDEITDEQKLNEITSAQNGNIFIGNGFNLTLGINTSYKSLFKSLIEYDFIKKMVPDNLYKKIADNEYNLEAYQNEITDKIQRSAMMTKFYETILRNCRVRYKYKEVVSFLLNFSNFFTINYDPLLYRFLLQSKNTTLSDENDEFYKNLKSIHEGSFTNTGYGEKPLKSLVKKQVYDLARQIFKENKIHKNKKREDYYNILKKLRQEKTIQVNDGFVINPKSGNSHKKYKIWDRNCPDTQNIFYLHGALHIYQKNTKVMKLILNKGHHDKKFINHILSEGKENSCIFKKTYKEKLREIEKNIYLSNCLQKFKTITGQLFIIGWSCSESDEHLIHILKNNNDIRHMYISYYIPETKKQFSKNFPKKNITFFHSNILPFAKK